jgi:hypothetical protein
MTLPRHNLLVRLVLLLGLSVVPISANAAQLAMAWSDNAVDEDGFLVERRNAAGGAFAQIISLGPNTVAYLDSGVAAGSTYCYRVRAFNSVGMSAYTNEACGTATATSGSPLSVSLPKSTYSTRETLVATVNAVAGAVPTPVDAYVVVQAPGGGLLSLLLDGRLVPGLVPIASGIVLPSVAAPFGLPLAGAPPGSYTWLAAVTSPGTLTLVSPIVSTPFTIVP